MNTKKAFSDIEYYLNEYLNDGITKDKVFEAIDVIKDKLKRGEKFEEMWKWLEKIYIKEDNTFKLHNEWGYFCDIKEMTTDIKQKYFPK